jgi:hypothetical protein
LWDELGRDILRRSSATQPHVPGSAGAAPLLELDVDGSTLKWHFASPGDYDQNGEVNVADLTPLGLHFAETGPFDPLSVLSVIDGDATAKSTSAT